VLVHFEHNFFDIKGLMAKGKLKPLTWNSPQKTRFLLSFNIKLLTLKEMSLRRKCIGRSKPSSNIQVGEKITISIILKAELQIIFKFHLILKDGKVGYTAPN
jgi:hypothetical protein